MAPSRAYLAERAGETPALTTWGAAASGFDFAREYQATKAGLDAYTHAYAGGAQQRDAMRPETARPVSAKEQQPSETAREQPAEGVRQSDTARPEASRPAAATEQQPGEAAREQPQAADEEATAPAPVGLPPGSYHAPLVPLMNRILAVRGGEDVSGLRREINAAFHAYGDVTAGNQVHAYLSDLVEDGDVPDAQRHEVAAALARYATANPEKLGHFRETLTLGAVAIRGSSRVSRSHGRSGDATDAVSTPALRGSAYHPDTVEARVKPEY